MPGAVAVSEWTLRASTTEAALARIARAGFRRVELGGGEPDVRSARRALAATGLAATSVCPLLGPRRDLASHDDGVRAAAIDTVRRWVDVAAEVGASVVIVVPSDTPVDGGPDSRARAAASLRVIADELQPTDPQLVIEPLNRYETHLVRTLDDAALLCEEVASPAVRLMADTFHMAIEEDDPRASLSANASRLGHLHLADNQRRAPGTGRLDFAELRRTLDQIGFAGTAALECLPCGVDDLRAAARNLAAAGWAL